MHPAARQVPAPTARTAPPVSTHTRTHARRGIPVVQPPAQSPELPAALVGMDTQHVCGSDHVCMYACRGGTRGAAAGPATTSTAGGQPREPNPSKGCLHSSARVRGSGEWLGGRGYVHGAVAFSPRQRMGVVQSEHSRAADGLPLCRIDPVTTATRYRSRSTVGGCGAAARCPMGHPPKNTCGVHWRGTQPRLGLGGGTRTRSHPGSCGGSVGSASFLPFLPPPFFPI